MNNKLFGRTIKGNAKDIFSRVYILTQEFQKLNQKKIVNM